MFIVVRADDLLAKCFGPGANGPLVAAVTIPPGDTKTLDRLTQVLSAEDGVLFVNKPTLNAAKDTAVVVIIPLTSPQDLKTQADAYARLFGIFLKHKDHIERVTFWGLNDRRTWRFGQNPLIFDANNQRKPAYVAIVDEAQRLKQ